MSHPGVAPSGHILTSNGITHQYTVLSGDIAGIAHDTKLRRLMGASVVDATPQAGLFLGYDGSNFTLLPASGSGGVQSNVFATGIVIGTVSPLATGVLLSYDVNGALIVSKYASAQSSIIKVDNIKPYTGEDVSIFGDLGPQGISITSGSLTIGASTTNTILTDSNYTWWILRDSLDGNTANAGGLGLGSSKSIKWASSETQINDAAITIFDVGISRSGVGLLGFNNPTTKLPATGHFGANIFGPLSISGARVSNDNDGALLIQNGIGQDGQANLGPSGVILFGKDVRAVKLRREAHDNDPVFSAVGLDGNYVRINAGETHFIDFANSEITMNPASSAMVLSSAASICWSRTSNADIAILSDSDIAMSRSGVNIMALFSPIFKGAASGLVGGIIWDGYNTDGVLLKRSASATLRIRNGNDTADGHLIVNNLTVNGTHNITGGSSVAENLIWIGW